MKMAYVFEIGMEEKVLNEAFLTNQSSMKELVSECSTEMATCEV